MAADAASDAFLLIDGSQGEGGGQILRTSLALSAITRRPVRIVNIRAKRPKPGLSNQHLAAVRAAATLSRGKLVGDAVGSTELVFCPGTEPIHGGKFNFEIGSAGSGTLVLQTVLPILLTAEMPSFVEIAKCGTHNPMSPPFDFLQESFVPQLKKMGITVEISLIKPGFYPAGGGCIRASISPIKRAFPFMLIDRGALINRSIVAAVSNLPQTVADRQIVAARKALNWTGVTCESARVKTSAGPGNYVIAKCEFENNTEIATGFSDRGVSAEAVAEVAATEMQAYLKTAAPVGEHLADQLLLPMVLASGGTFRCGVVSTHLTTNVDVIALFCGACIDISEPRDGMFDVIVRGMRSAIEKGASAGAGVA
jgi:RNA 3'-terminal phosphate cyclase (ATP)